MPEPTDSYPDLRATSAAASEYGWSVVAIDAAELANLLAEHDALAADLDELLTLLEAARDRVGSKAGSEAV